MTAWLTDTLFYTGALIALVLVLRGPVARAFGPQIAYALWALPLVRFVMPPIQLPSSMAPAGAVSAADFVPPLHSAAAPGAIPATAIAAPPPAEAATLPLFDGLTPSALVAAGAGRWFDPAVLIDAAIAVWLAGAVVFLAWRGWTYLRMREELLRAARPVGEAGKVRLVETPAVNGPIAFGVSDKVVALPPGFMAWGDRHARDLAIEHELAHHRGGDLLANMLAQPVLALHWFNPLAWIGWRAMRRDQEAACDARVMAWRGPNERAAYGKVIASFAAGPRLALAAPMACPMFGQKSIIHRLRSLAMTEISPHRRMAGRALLAGAVLALPFTASFSYAEAQVPPPAPFPMAAPPAPDAPDAPEAPELMLTGDDDDVEVEVREEDGKRIVTITRRVREGEAPANGPEGERKAVRRVVIAPNGAPRQMEFRFNSSGMSEEEWERQAREWERRAAEYAEQWERWGEEFAEKWEREWPEMAPVPPAPPQPPMGFAVPIPRINFACDKDSEPVKAERADGEGQGVHRIVLCRQQKIADGARARAALERARASVAHDRALSDEVREEVLKSLDREIERLEKEG